MNTSLIKKIWGFGLVGLLMACKPSAQFLNADVTGAGFKTDVPLMTTTGNQLQLNQPNPSQVTALFFGFTQCPDVCPTTLGTMKLVTKELGSDASKLRVVFVTVDPERDSMQVMKEYIGAFDPHFIGAYTDLPHTKQLATGYQVTFEKVGDPAFYTMNHSANIFLIDAAGRTRVSIPYGSSASSIAHDVKQLLAHP